MSWRFAPSKYKNTTPRAPKKEETLFDVPVGVLLMGNNGIQCSARFMAFGLDGEGGKLGVLPIDARGRRQRSEMKIVCAHGEPLNDFTFFPFDQNLLATCSREEKLKLWKCDQGEEFACLEEPDITVDIEMGGGIECLSPHTIAEQLIAAGTNISVSVVDAIAGKSTIDMELRFDDRVDSMSWSLDGKLLAVIGDKGKSGSLFDPRSNNPEIAKFELHSGSGRESRIVFVDENKILSSGFAAKRVQEVRLYDVRKNGALIYAQEYSSSTGILIPLYDYDTKLLFLVGKGTNKLIIAELQDKSPPISPVYNFVMQSQTIGACLGCKYNLDVMAGEVDRVYQLGKSSIIPVPCIVPRRSYRDFHQDLFPDTRGTNPGCTAAEWLAGSNAEPACISLDPAKNEVPLFGGEDLRPSSRPRKLSTGEILDAEAAEAMGEGEEGGLHIEENKDKLKKTVAKNPSPQLPTQGVWRRTQEDVTNRSSRTKIKSIVGLASKYRHVETVPGGKHATFTNIRNVNTRMPTEANGFCVSAKYAAVPLGRPLGAVSIVDLSNIIKMPDGVVDGIQNETGLNDLMWNPFDPETLACALDNGAIFFWRIENLETPLALLEPADVLKVSPNAKVILIRYNPVAADIIAVASHCAEKSISVWNTETKECVWYSAAHKDGSTLAMAWSADGRKLATVGRDLKISIFKPQLKENSLIISKPVLESPRGARILFACDDSVLVLVHFTKSSGRQLTLLNAENLSVLMGQQIDTSSQPLIPHYDYDSSVIFLTGKGDRQIAMYEIMPTSPYLLQLTPSSFQLTHQAISLHHKVECNVRVVEFAKGWRLTEKTIEQLSFRIPRVKKDAFQCDLFPDALVTWMPSLTAADWIAGSQEEPFLIDLCPEGVQRVAISPQDRKKLKRPKKAEPAAEKPMDLRTLEMGLSNRIEEDHTLEQDKMEGVDASEWKEEGAKNQAENEMGNQEENHVEYQAENQEENQVGNLEENQVGNLEENQVGNLEENQVGNLEENQVGNQEENQAENQVGNQVEEEQKNIEEENSE